MDTGKYGLLNSAESKLWGPGSKSAPPLNPNAEDYKPKTKLSSSAPSWMPSAGKRRKSRRNTRKSKKTRKSRK